MFSFVTLKQVLDRDGNEWGRPVGTRLSWNPGPSEGAAAIQ